MGHDSLDTLSRLVRQLATKIDQLSNQISQLTQEEEQVMATLDDVLASVQQVRHVDGTDAHAENIAALANERRHVC